MADDEDDEIADMPNLGRKPLPNRDDHDEIEVDTSHITRHPPDEDIDQYVEDCDFRIERLGKDGLWVCAYTHDDESDHHYNISAREDGLHIRHRAEDGPEGIRDDESESRDAVVRLTFEEGYGFSARHVPSGIASQGENEEEALRALAEALTLHRRDDE